MYIYIYTYTIQIHKRTRLTLQRQFDVVCRRFSECQPNSTVSLVDSKAAAGLVQPTAGIFAAVLGLNGNILQATQLFSLS